MKTTLWIFGLPKDRSSALRLLKNLGYEAVTVGKDREAVEAIVREDLEAHVVLGTFSLADKKSKERESLLARRLDGTPAEWFGSGCPNNPKIRASSLDLVREAASIEGVKAVILDGIRFASPGEGIETFMTCFCNWCSRKARDLGYDVREMKTSLRGVVRSIKDLTPSILNSIGNWRSPTDLLDPLIRFPGVLEWLRFRSDCIVEHVTDVKKAVGKANPKCKLGAYIFTPSLSYFVGQDYRRLAGLLDYVEPMIYRTGKGVACLNYEVARIAADIHERASSLDQVEIQDFLFHFLGLDAKPESSIKKLEEGISFEAIESETRRAMSTIEASKLVPILYLEDPHLRESVAGALRAGIRNISFFSFHEGAENAVKTAAEIVRES